MRSPRTPLGRLAMLAIGLAIGAGGALGSIAVIACSLALSFDGIADGVADAGDGSAADGSDSHVDGATGKSDASDGSTSADGARTDAGGDAGAEGGCPTGKGPAMIRIDRFCIDTTEVTVDQYSEFLFAKAGDTSGEPPECSWNGSLVPSGTWPPAGPGTTPVTSVNWCKAFAYCAWAGKELCGDPDGGPADMNGWTDPAKSAWFKACTRNNDGLHAYPYSNTYDAHRCNGADYDAGAPLPSLASCEGGYPGLFDMSGNVYEWENACTPPSDAGANTAFCNTRGGSFVNNANDLRCDNGLEYTRESETVIIGFRCCAH